MPKRKPLLTAEHFKAAHNERDNAMLEYLLSKRGESIDPSMVERVLDRAAHQLFAANSRARISLAGQIRKHMEESLKPDPQRAFSFVTFTPREWALPLSAAAAFDHAAIRQEAKATLGGFQHIGVIEVALYTNCNVIPGTTGWMVAPHYHALTWGHEEEAIRELAAEANQSHEALLLGRIAFHYRMLAGKKALGRINYMMKAPLSEYRVIPKKGELVDLETGEITVGLTGSFNQKKRGIRKGDAWKMCAVLDERVMPDLMFAEGEGATILQRSVEQAVQRIDKADAKKRRKHIERRLTR